MRIGAATIRGRNAYLQLFRNGSGFRFNDCHDLRLRYHDRLRLDNSRHLWRIDGSHCHADSRAPTVKEQSTQLYGLSRRRDLRLRNYDRLGPNHCHHFRLRHRDGLRLENCHKLRLRLRQNVKLQ
jgi:hypothetical protein